MARSTGRVRWLIVVRCERFWGLQTGPNPTDRAKRGSKRYLICDGHGIPLAIELTGANCHDSTQALPLLDAIPPLQGLRGRPRFRPDCLLGGRAYDAQKIRRALRARHILPLLAMRNTENLSGLGRWRWVVERTFAWMNQFRRLRLRYEKRADMHLALLTLGCILICWKFLQARSPLPCKPTNRTSDRRHGKEGP
jgi:transposase